MSIIEDFFNLKSYTVIDTETTGLDCRKDDIIEVSALKIVDDKIVDSFSELVNTNIEISPFITNLTGIDNSMLKDADDISSVLCRLFDFIGDDIIVGHNIAFDMRFISWQSQLNFGVTPLNSTLDTLKFSCEVLNETKCHKLAFLKDYYGIDGSSHRALEDCNTTYALIYKLKETAKSSDLI